MMFTVRLYPILEPRLAPTCMVNEEVNAKMISEGKAELINRLRGENG